MSLRSPLSKAVGLGSAKHGFSHWWWQRVTAIALIPLALWFVVSVLSIISGGHAEAHAWLSSPVNATLMLLFVLTGLYHAQTGMQVVIEDYVQPKWLNLLMLLVIKFAAAIMALMATIAVLKISVGV